MEQILNKSHQKFVIFYLKEKDQLNEWKYGSNMVAKIGSDFMIYTETISVIMRNTSCNQHL